MTKFNDHLKQTIYFVLGSYLIGLVALLFIYSQISNLDYTTTTMSKEQCTEKVDANDAVVASCEVYLVKKDWRPYIIPAVVYLAIIICGLVHINRELKVILKELELFNIKSQQAITNMKTTQINFRFHELNQVFTLLNQNIEELNNNDKIRHNYVSCVMHDLKTPLQVIHGYIDILKSGISKQSYYVVIEEQIAHINNIAQTTTYISGYIPDIKSVRINVLLLKLIADYKIINPKLEFHTTLESVVWKIDYNGLLRCLHNLVNNSLEAGSTVIKIVLQPTKLELIDDGSGFSQEEYSEYIAYSSKSQGHFGLKMVNTIIMANDLQIKYSKQPGGTIVTIVNNNHEPL